MKCNQSIAPPTPHHHHHHQLTNTTARCTSLFHRAVAVTGIYCLRASIVRRRRPPSPTVRCSGRPLSARSQSSGIHPSSNSGLPTRPSTSRGSTSPLGARHPPTRKAKVRRPASNPRCSSSTLRRQEEPWEQRERTSSTIDAPCFTSPLSHLHPSLSPPPNTAPPTHLLSVAVHPRLSTVEAPVPPPHIPCATALGAL